ncbi:MAG TPA: cellulase family glycosylhydrolase [Anaerolineaceae bacterium]|nr:cellulase family glycosylhydrolase [Anaerolineaceae bacterium]
MTFLTRRQLLRRALLGTAAATLSACLPPAPTSTAALVPSAFAPTNNPTRAPDTAYTAARLAARLPRWHGFNLLEKFIVWEDQPFKEWDFDFLAHWGFDFVRLPTDYRIFMPKPDVYNEQGLRELDQAIAWGQARGIHVNLCLHRAPGYTVNVENEEILNLFTPGDEGAGARLQFAGLWRMFAARYRGIPPEQLSFNLVNEPAEVEGETVRAALQPAIEDIRAEDANRLIIADGTYWARKPIPELIALGVAQSMHCYDPMGVTHYAVDWIEDAKYWPEPSWPIDYSLNAYLYGADKPELQSPLVLEGDFSADATLSLRVVRVSRLAELQILADGAIVFAQRLETGAGEGEWKSSEWQEQWGIYQALYDRDYTAYIPAGTRRVELRLGEGDWLTFSQIKIEPYTAKEGPLYARANDARWGILQQPLTIDEHGALHSAEGAGRWNRQRLWDESVQPFVDLAARGVGVHVGEFAVGPYTPHTVALAWISDCLANWRQAGFGWAMWNLRGGMGILDSGRADVQYEDYDGHLLDRKMLDLLLADMQGEGE